jgi:hypothetical protein
MKPMPRRHGGSDKIHMIGCSIREQGFARRPTIVA